MKIHADRALGKIEQDISPIPLCTCGVCDHVPEIRKSIQTEGKENRLVFYTMLYKYLPQVMVRK